MFLFLLACQSTTKFTPAPPTADGPNGDTLTLPTYPAPDTSDPLPPTPAAPCGTLLAATAFSGPGDEWVADGTPTSDAGTALFFEFDESFVLGAGGATEVEFVAASRDDGALARYDAAGALLWARHIAAADTAKPIAIEAGPGGDVVVTGVMSGVTRFAVGAVDEVEFDVGSNIAGYVARFAADGALSWVVEIGGGEPREAVVLADGAVAVVGQYIEPVVFDRGPGETVLPVIPGTLRDGFVAVLDGDDGSLEWAESAGGTEEMYLFDAVEDPLTGDLLVVGHLIDTDFVEGTVAFSGGVSFDDALRDAFLVRYARAGGATGLSLMDGTVLVREVAVGVAGTPIAVFGWYGDDARFDAGQPAEQALDSGEAVLNAFVATYGADLRLLWVVEDPAIRDGAAYGIAGRVTPDGGIVYAGQYNSGVTVGGQQPNAVALEYPDTNDDAYVARLEANGQLRCVVSLKGAVPQSVLARADGTTFATGGGGGLFYPYMHLAEGAPDEITYATAASDGFSAVFSF